MMSYGACTALLQKGHEAHDLEGRERRKSSLTSHIHTAQGPLDLIIKSDMVDIYSCNSRISQAISILLVDTLAGNETEFKRMQYYLNIQ